MNPELESHRSENARSSRRLRKEARRTLTKGVKKLPRIVVDARMVGPIGHGIAEYLMGMVRGLAKLDLNYQLIFLVRPGMEKRFEPFDAQSMNTPFLNPLEWTSIPSELRKLKADLYHSPSFASLPHCPCPSLITLHDLNHLQFGSFLKRAYYTFLVRKFANQSEVLSVSGSSANEIAAWLGKDRSEINVVSNAIEMEGHPSEEIIGLKPGSYFLCLSNAKTHKNMAFLIKAYETARDRWLREASNKFRAANEFWPLVIPFVPKGGPPPGVIVRSNLDRPMVDTHLAAAGALLFPSIYEGFGRPPLEAMIRGVPAIVSRIPVHEEVMGRWENDGVEFLHPSDLEGWANCMIRAVSMGLKPVQIAVREEIQALYSIDNLGKKMDQIYRRMLNPNP